MIRGSKIAENSGLSTKYNSDTKTCGFPVTFPSDSPRLSALQLMFLNLSRSNQLVNVGLPDLRPLCLVRLMGLHVNNIYFFISYWLHPQLFYKLQILTNSVSHTIGCFKDLQLNPQLNPNLTRVGVQVGVQCLNAIYFCAIWTSTHTSTSPLICHATTINNNTSTTCNINLNINSTRSRQRQQH